MYYNMHIIDCQMAETRESQPRLAFGLSMAQNSDTMKSKEKILIALKKRTVKIKSPDLKKYCGSISLQEDPMELQKKMRDEWE